jgi:hypothetical protein
VAGRKAIIVAAGQTRRFLADPIDAPHSAADRVVMLRRFMMLFEMASMMVASREPPCADLVIAIPPLDAFVASLLA